jgi:hypothetical protein
MRDGGSIVITYCVAATRSAAGAYAYITAKHARIGLMRCLAKELAQREVVANRNRLYRRHVRLICPFCIGMRASVPER